MEYSKLGVFPKHINNQHYYKSKVFIFVDISGFTPLCDEFIKNSNYGAERIGDLLNNIFSPIINLIYEEDGDIISFAGDALFAAIDEKNIIKIKKKIEDSVHNYSKKIKKYLSVTIEQFSGNYYPFFIKGHNKEHFTYYNSIQNSNKILFTKNNVFPNEIFEIANSEFNGELRAIPIFFLHIDGQVKIDTIRELLKKIIDNSVDYSIYVNKIEYLDKGWMILLSSGLPIYSANSQYKIYDFLRKIIKIGQKEKIGIKIGGTLRRGYAGIIGNKKRWEYTFIGSNVNLAARIAVKAEPNKIFTDEEFANTVKEKIDISHFASKKYKGIEKEVNIYEIKNYKKRIEKKIFVGRENELNDCINFLNKPNTILLISGSSGVGKTEFVRQIIHVFGKKSLTLKGVHGNQMPFYLFEDFLSFFGKSKNKQSKRELIQKLFRSIKSPIIIFIDDVSYADSYSEEIIKWMISEGNEFVNIVITAFTENEINTIIPPVKEYDIKKMTLSNLSLKNVQELFFEYTKQKINKHIAKNIIKITGGNPLFLVYLIKFIGKDIMKNPDTPYSLKELILLRVKELPYNGENVIEGGAVYGDVFDALIVADSIKFNAKKLKEIIDYAIHYGMLQIIGDFHTIVFSNAIIRETIYETLLEKQVKYIRIKLGEIILENNKYFKSKKIAAQLFYLANDNRCLNVFRDLIFNENVEDFESQRSYYIKYFNFIIKNKMYSYAKLIDMIEHSLNLPLFYFNAELALLLYNLASKVQKWNGKENLLLKISMAISSFLMDNKRANVLLNIYGRKVGRNKYFKWYFNVINKYSATPANVLKTYEEIENKFDGHEKISFYLNYIAYVFFIIGDYKREKYILKQLKKLENSMTAELKAEYYQLLNSLSMHRDNIEQSIKYLNKLKIMKLNNKYYKFLTYNDLAIIYNQIGIKNLDNKMLRRSIIYMIKAYKFVKDAGMKTNMPLITTNLGSSYSSNGNIKKAIKYYYEGYLYGKDINHPVELPYTMSRISRLAYTYGADKLAIILSNEIISKHEKVGDLLPVAYAMLYNISLDKEDYKKGIKIAEDYLEKGIGKCIGEIYTTLFWGGFLENKTKLLKESYKLMKKYKGKLRKRSIQKFVDEIMFEILEIILFNKSTKNLKKQLRHINKIDKLFTLKIIMNYVLAMRENNLKNRKAYLEGAYFISKKIKFYSLYDRIFELNKTCKSNIISNQSMAQLNRYKRTFKNIKSIEEFYKFFNKN